MTLKEKILNVMKSVAVIKKNAHNDEKDYDFVSVAKLNEEVSTALRENRVICLPTANVIEIQSVQTNGGNETLATVAVDITLQDVDSDESFTIRGVGSGIDKGDKSVAKAQTMAMKYAWKMAFVIAESNDDPDTNKANESTGAYTAPKAKPAPSSATTKNSVWIK